VTGCQKLDGKSCVVVCVTVSGARNWWSAEKGSAEARGCTCWAHEGIDFVRKLKTSQLQNPFDLPNSPWSGVTQSSAPYLK